MARFGVALALMRLFAVVAVFQVSALSHFASDLVAEIVLGHHPDEDAAPNESDPDHDCPPGCPTCHHVHMSGASLPPAPFFAAWAPMTGVATDVPYDSYVPPGPPPSSVYRPPRA